MSKIAIFGGTFDPIHLAHIRLAETAVNELYLDKVIFMPNAVSPFKLDAKISSGADRCNMIELAIQGNPQLELTRYEIEKQGISYTYETLIELSRIYSSRLYFILGYDSVVAIDKWHRGANILREFPLITALRPGTENEIGKNKIREYRELYSAEIHILRMPPIDCSSSAIREACRAGNPLTGLVDEKVEEYIIANELYKD